MPTWLLEKKNMVSLSSEVKARDINGVLQEEHVKQQMIST